MSVQNMQSNAVRGKYMHEVMDKTIDEIYSDMITVFGPGAQDAFITKDGQPYYTRDGKEVIQSLKFDNELSMYVLKIIYQAVFNQAKAVGDGTTTVAVLYTALYKILRKQIENGTLGYISRDSWNRATKLICDELKKLAVPMDDKLLQSMLYTCTQDSELAYKIYHNLKDAIMSKAYITINKSNIEQDFEMIVNQKPLIPATRQWSIRPIGTKEDNCIIFHCNGLLDITHKGVFLDLMSHMSRGVPATFIILCNGIMDSTRRTLKDVVTDLNLMQKQDSNFNIETYSNIGIYTLDNYRKYDNSQIEDISTIITDENGLGGLVNALTFESLLYQAFHNPEYKIEDLETFDCDIRHITKIQESLNSPYTMEFDDTEGIKIHKELGPVAKARYDDLRKELEEEKSEVRKVTLQRRLKTMYGEFIEINVGSKLIKDSQRKYELILDAVLSAGEGVEHGVLTANSLVLAGNVIMKLLEDHKDDSVSLAYVIIAILMAAINNTILPMAMNVDPKFTLEHIQTFYDNPDSFNLDIEDSNVKTGEVDGVSYIIDKQIVEPVTIITTMLENSTTILDLAQARTFHLNSFMNNYL